MRGRWSQASLLVVLAFAVLLAANEAAAQSAIAGVVRDTSGAVLPGVTVEASSPVLIEKVRTATTDGAGAYRVVDLRPGVYSVRFSLPGFGTVVRDKLELQADFTAPLNIEMSVGALEETVTVSGASPVVDVQTVTRRDVLAREFIDALPTGRNFQTAGATMPSVSMGRFDIGGSTAMQTGNTLVAAGSRANDTTEEVDGMGINSALGSSSNVPVYLNNAVYEEQVYTLVGGSADTQTPGVKINLIPKSGGNEFSGTAVAIYANQHFQARNISAEEAARQGQLSAARLDQLWDYNAALGGRIVRDRLWFYTSWRHWGYNNFGANALLADGSQAVDTNRLQAYNLRLTGQAGDHRLTAMYDKFPKWRGRRNIEAGTFEPDATYIQNVPLAYNAQAKWSATMASRIFAEAGWSTNFYNYWLNYQDGLAPTATNPLGVISKVDLNTNRTYDAARNVFNSYFDRDYLVSSVSYVTGSHSFKVGEQFSTGWVINKQFANGDLFEQYRGIPGRGGRPEQVTIYNTPTFNRTDLDVDLGVYAQDTWKLRRVTVTPGIRFDVMRQSVAPTCMPAGRFVPERCFDEIPNVADWTDWSPRVGVAWDVFGTGKTAIRFSAGKYMQRDSVSFASNYNPSALLTCTRTWNGDRDAQGLPTNLGPCATANFGSARAVNTRADDIQRPYQTVYNWAVQHEIAPRTSVSGNIYMRKYRNIHGTINLVVPASAWVPRNIADPRGNGEVITIYDILPQWNGQQGQNLQTVSSDVNSQSYLGYDVNVNARLGNGATINGGVSVGRTHQNNCDVFNPNELRFCDTSLYDIPWQPTYKINGVYPLPFGIRFSGVFQSALFEYSDTYLINRTVAPGLVLTSVTPNLDPPGSTFYPRANLLDLGIAKTFRVGKATIIPTLEFFNVMNSNTVQTWVTAYGPNLHNVNTNMLGRLIRPQVTVNW